MGIHELKAIYENLLYPIFGEQFRIDDSDEDKNWVVIILDGTQEEKDCTYITKKETVKGKTLSGYDDIKDYVIIAKTGNLNQHKYQLSNITIEYVV